MNLSDQLVRHLPPEATDQHDAQPSSFSNQALRERLAEPPTVATMRGPVDPYGALKTRVHQSCIQQIGASLFRTTEDQELRARVEQAVSEQLTVETTPLSQHERQQLLREISDDILGYGPLEPLLADPSVTEIMVNSFDQIYVERDGRIEATTAAFIDDDHLLRIIDRIVSRVGRRIDEGSPMVDARLSDGSRVNAIIPPLSLEGPALTIRKFSKEAFSLDDLVAKGALSPPAAAFLGACVRGKLNVLISGGTGAGKTTLLNALSAHIPGDERIITIEDAAELKLQQRHVIRLESRPPNLEGQGEVRIRELVRNALRMRPDRIVVGEVRGAETVDMLQAMNTGHEGSLTTIHANSGRDALSRLEMLVMTAGVELPHRAIREQISRAFDLIVQVARLVDGSRRVTHVTEVLGMESDVVSLQDLYVARPAENDVREGTLLEPLRATGLPPRFLGKLSSNGITLEPRLFDAATVGDVVVAGHAWAGRREAS